MFEKYEKKICKNILILILLLSNHEIAKFDHICSPRPKHLFCCWFAFKTETKNEYQIKNFPEKSMFSTLCLVRWATQRNSSRKLQIQHESSLIKKNLNLKRRSLG
jgi:hypothetical protein